MRPSTIGKDPCECRAAVSGAFKLARDGCCLISETGQQLMWDGLFRENRFGIKLSGRASKVSARLG